MSLQPLIRPPCAGGSEGREKLPASRLSALADESNFLPILYNTIIQYPTFKTKSLWSGGLFGVCDWSPKCLPWVLGARTLAIKHYKGETFYTQAHSETPQVFKFIYKNTYLKLCSLYRPEVATKCILSSSLCKLLLNKLLSVLSIAVLFLFFICFFLSEGVTTDFQDVILDSLYPLVSPILFSSSLPINFLTHLSSFLFTFPLCFCVQCNWIDPKANLYNLVFLGGVDGFLISSLDPLLEACELEGSSQYLSCS